ncbi:MAG TPA: acyl-CoA dehydrogenase family protein [Acidimicrobiia bacterium]|nr:acyl-CoA dehydrogenase family protein [Acidimicrobiia bacterium]
MTTTPTDEAGAGADLGAVLAELRAWLDANWDPDLTLRDWWQRLADSGWAQSHWPAEWHGRGLPRVASSAVSRAIRDFGAVPGVGGFGTGLAGPTLLVHGTDDQRRRHLPGMVNGADAYCQLFSEPNAGSDLAGLQTRAVRDGDEWVINGQKVWTSSGQIADKAILVARTNVDVPKHAGISYFIVDMHQPQIEVRPLREMTGRSFFNEVFLEGARIPADDLIGGEGEGWAVANTTLAVERAGSAGGGAVTSARPGTIAGDLDRRVGDFVAGAGDATDASDGIPTRGWERLAALARTLGRSDDPLVRDALTRLLTQERVVALTGQRARALQQLGRELPGLPNLAKMGQNLSIRMERDVTFRILRGSAMLHGYDPESVAAVEAATGIAELGDLLEAALFAQGPPIYGGSDQIQRNIVGERVLGLAREPSSERGVAFKDLLKN